MARTPEQLQFKPDEAGGSWTAMTMARVYEIRLVAENTTQAELRMRPRAVLAGVPVAEQWQLLDTYKNPAVALAYAQWEEDNR